MTHIKNNPPVPSFYEDKYPLPWMMSVWEKHTFISLLSALKPAAAIEIGNARGGSLQVLYKLVPTVFAIDLYPQVHEPLKLKFPEIQFFTGKSWEILPGLLEKISREKIKLGFILIDGDHTSDAVKNDINAILKNYKPCCRLVILFHDSFNPECRKGILQADWEGCPFVHQVDIDYIPGTYVTDMYNGKTQQKTMWGGFCMAVLEPTERKEALNIHESAQLLFEQAFKGSFYNTLRYKMHKLLNKLK